MKSPDLEHILVETYWNTIHPWQVVFVISPISFGCAKNLPSYFVSNLSLRKTSPFLAQLAILGPAFFAGHIDTICELYVTSCFLYCMESPFESFFCGESSNDSIISRVQWICFQFQRISLQSPPTKNTQDVTGFYPISFSSESPFLLVNKKYSGCHWFLSNVFFQWITVSFGQQKILRMSLVFIQFLFPVNHLFFWSTKNTQDVTGFYLMFVSSESPFLLVNKKYSGCHWFLSNVCFQWITFSFGQQKILRMSLVFIQVLFPVNHLFFWSTKNTQDVTGFYPISFSSESPFLLVNKKYSGCHWFLSNFFFQWITFSFGQQKILRMSLVFIQFLFPVNHLFFWSTKNTQDVTGFYPISFSSESPFLLVNQKSSGCHWFLSNFFFQWITVSFGQQKILRMSLVFIQFLFPVNHLFFWSTKNTQDVTGFYPISFSSESPFLLVNKKYSGCHWFLSNFFFQWITFLLVNKKYSGCHWFLSKFFFQWITFSFGQQKILRMSLVFIQFLFPVNHLFFWSTKNTQDVTGFYPISFSSESPFLLVNKKYSGCHWFLSNFFFQWITFSFGQQKILRMSLVFIQFLFPVNHLFFWSTKNTQDVTGFYPISFSSESPFLLVNKKYSGCHWFLSNFFFQWITFSFGQPKILRMSLVFIQFLFPVNHLFFWSTKNTQDVTGFYLMFVSSESPFLLVNKKYSGCHWFLSNVCFQWITFSFGQQKYSGCHWFLSNVCFQWITFSFGQQKILRMSLVFIQFLFPVNHLFFWSTKNTQDVTGFYPISFSSESPFLLVNKKYSGCHWFLSNFFFQWITFSFGQQKILRMSLVFIQSLFPVNRLFFWSTKNTQDVTGFYPISFSSESPFLLVNKKYSGCHWFLSNFFFQWITFSFGQQKILRMSLVFIQFLFPVNHLFFWSTKNTQDVTGFYPISFSSESPFLLVNKKYSGCHWFLSNLFFQWITFSFGQQKILRMSLVFIQFLFPVNHLFFWSTKNTQDVTGFYPISFSSESPFLLVNKKYSGCHWFLSNVCFQWITFLLNFGE